jgi:hypothetical protein
LRAVPVIHVFHCCRTSRRRANCGHHDIGRRPVGGAMGDWRTRRPADKSRSTILGEIGGRRETGCGRMQALDDRQQAAVDAAATVEAALTTLAGAIRGEIAAGRLDLGDAGARFVRAAQCADAQHLALLQSFGGVPAALSFAIPADALAGKEHALAAMIALKGIAVGAAMALTRAWAERADGHRVEILFAWGAAEAAALAIAQSLAGAQPANDRAFAAWRFRDAADALAAVKQDGWLDAADAPLAYPGPAAIDCEGVRGLVPETTDDAPIIP